MLLQLENAPKIEIQKLLAFAKEHHLQLSIVAVAKSKSYLPGKPLSAKELNRLIKKSRKSGTASMEKAHQEARKKIESPQPAN